MDEDEAALLAELRAISNGSTAATRFEQDDENNNRAPTQQPIAAEDARDQSNDMSFVSAKSSCSTDNFQDALPGSVKKDTQSFVDVSSPKSDEKMNANDNDNVVEAPSSSPTAAVPETNEESETIKPSTNETASLGIKSNLPTTFQGDRGGAAEDEELLAELRAIYLKSSSADRFATDDDKNDSDPSTGIPESEKNVNVAESKKGPTESASTTKKSRDSAQIPPWKRGKKKEPANVQVDIVVTAPPPPPSVPVVEPNQTDTSENVAPQSSGIKDSVPSTFTGDRGGAAEDAELLAELRAISAKSSGSDRFAQDEGAPNITEEAVNAERDITVEHAKSGMPASAEKAPETDAATLPPWKRGKKMAAESVDVEVDVVVAAPPPPSVPVVEPDQTDTSESVPPQSFGVKDSAQSTFTGDRGGAAEDADLLAELRAISAKSSGTDRFADESTGNVGEASETEAVVENVVVPPSKKHAKENVANTSKPKAASEKLPPWKRGKTKASKSSADEVDIVVAAPPSPATVPEPVQSQEPAEIEQPNLGIKSALPSTFQGDRGGSAEDAELLAELRAISQKSSSADRFADDSVTNGGEASTTGPVSNPVAESSATKAAIENVSRPQPSPSKANPKSTVLPPWKRGKKKPAESSNPDVDIVVAAPPGPSSQPAPIETRTSEPVPETFGIKSSLPSTFKGDRGGTAEDEELLAELRAISAKSSGTDRFAEENSGGEVLAAAEPVDNSMAAAPKQPRSRAAPKPSKTKARTAQLPPWKRGKKKVAEAADVDVVVAAPSPAPIAEKIPNPQQDTGIKSSLPSTFQGDRGGPAEDAELLAELRAVSSQPKEGIKSDLPSTFKGERGGSAEDADLLAELRAISSNSSSGNRFSDESAVPESSKITEHQPVSNKPAPAPVREGMTDGSLNATTIQATKSPAPPSNAAADAGSEVNVTRESLSSAVTDKSWKLRKEAYVLLRNLLAERTESGEGEGNIDGNTLMPGLDEAISSMVSDSNAGALDTALAFAVDYAEHSSGASSSELAASIVSSLIKGNALSSSKPSTSKSATALTLKLMEVGGDGYTSVHAVAEVLLSQGLSSRKPKVVIATSGLILQAAYGFGAGSLPLASISSSAPKMLSHSNATVRETGLKIVAEICRSLGSKAPLQGLIDGIKKAQLSQLESMLESQPKPTPIGIGLRSMQGSSSQSPTDALAALETGAKELEARRYAEREPINVFQALPKTDYSTRIKLPKWSEKVAALDLVLECGGEKPYKLVPPSSSANYSPLISEMKTLLSHSHFAVASKSMKVLSMLAEGGGPGLFPNLRPLLGQLIMLSKDKKLNRAVGECLDVFFGNVLEIEHLLDNDDALPSVLNEKKQKNALVRASALDFLGRCIKRGESAGPRGRITSKSAAAVARLCCDKLEDSDASVRKAALESLRVLLSVDDDSISNAISPIIDSLESKNSRAYKSLKGSGSTSRSKGGVPSMTSTPNRAASGTRRTQTVPANPKPSSQADRNVSRSRSTAHSSTKASNTDHTRSTQSSDRAAAASSETKNEDASDSLSLEEAISLIASLNVPSWDAPDDDDGVLAGLKATKWLLRQNAILNLARFSKAEESPVATTEGVTSAFILVVKEHTKGFKETNVNVNKAIMELFIALCEVHAEQGRPFPGWASRDGEALAVDKIADKKLSSLAVRLLTEMCCVRPPRSVLEYGIICVGKVKSPSGHEAFLKWFNEFLNDFGATAISSALKDASPWLVKECESTNPKVRRMALAVAGELHVQLGPVSRALILSSCGDTSSIKSQLERTFDENPFDPDASKMGRSRECVVLQSNVAAGLKGEATASSILLDLPKIDLVASLPSDCIEKMGTKDGKNAWKLRKQALDDVEDAVKKTNGLISTDSLKPLIDLLRALRERLSDSQSNLKPVAARTIGSILGSVDAVSQAKLGRIAFAPLVGAVCNDNRKPMREASMEAIRVGTTASSVEGGEPNSSSLESLMVAVVGELGESEFKAGGIPDVLMFITGVAEFLPNLDSIASARAQTLGDKFAAVMVGCLTSSKSETRSTAENLLKACIENDKLSLASVKKGMKKLLPAQQRTVIPIVARLPHMHPGSPNDGKENSLPSPPRGSRQRKPPGVSAGRTAPSSPRHRGRPESSRRVEETATRPAPSSQANDSFEAESNEPDDLHPLIATGEPGKKPLPPSRRINWPLHPEEPNSPVQINALKRLWSRSLPHRSIHALFPSGGIKKQEDAMAGCALLCKAVEKDRTGSEEAIVDHMDLIFMWTSFALCSRESTVGLQSLITLLIRLFSFLEDHQYKLSDSDAYILLPHIFEKASIAKGRFREQFNNVLSFFRSDIVISTRSLGQVICVPLIDSHQSKTRVLALHECRSCVDRIGLSGLGKKGLLVTAKTISEESLPENRTAALELIETVLAKMDGDVEKLASFCGTGYLSDKGRDIIEEHWKKHGGSHQAVKSKNSQMDARSRRQSQIPSSRATSGIHGTRRAVPRSSQDVDGSPSSDREEIGYTSTRGLRDELPSFKLRLDEKKSSSAAARYSDTSLRTTGPFTFSFDTMQSSQNSSPATMKNEVANQEPVLITTHGTRAQQGSSAAASGTGVPAEGAAASLRARLLKIREKQKEQVISQPISSTTASQPALSPTDLASSPLTGRSSSPITNTEEAETEIKGGTSDDSSYDTLHACIEELLHTERPVPEAHPRIRDCTAALKKYHAAISNQPAAAPDMSSLEFSDLRQSIVDKTVEVIENLTSIVVFAFDCEFPENTAGMSIPLLSVALATLMALFRDSGLTQNVTQDALALLIREAGKALLDPRLAMSSHQAMASQLDESTSSQMVRAINKLAVQAATGSPRDVSIEALLALQLQLCTVGNETAADAAFNSRLSRIVTKLFAKVLKAEAATASPFSSETIDLEAIICALEDMLLATALAPGAPNRNRQDAVDTCSNMGRSLLIPILNARGEGGMEEFRAMMDELGIDSRESKLALLVTSCESELDFSAATNAAVDEEPTKVSRQAPPSPARPPSMNIASLVSELGSAPEGPKRDAAVAALRRYNELHGKAELHDHLSDVSEAFRAHIMEQLEESPSSLEKPSRGLDENITSQNTSMSERIRFLRSKLNATEAAVQSAVEQPTESTKSTVETTQETPTTPSRRGIPEPTTPSRRSTAAEARLTPSRIPKLSSTDRTSTSSSQPKTTGTALSLRERLAAAQKNRAKAAAENEAGSEDASGKSASAYGHAAALRARLEAVKQQSKRDIK